MTRYSIEPRTRKYVKGDRFLSFAIKYQKKLLDTEMNTSKKVIDKAAKATGELLGNKIADAVTRSNNDKIVKTKPAIDENSRNVEETIISPEKREEIFKKL